MQNEIKETRQHLALITVNELAKHLSVRPQALYREIEEHDWREEQGVFQILPGKRGIRVDEYLFLNWRRLPLSIMGDAHVRDVMKSLLGLLLPIRTALDNWIANCNRMYDDATVNIDLDKQMDGLQDGDGEDKP